VVMSYAPSVSIVSPSSSVSEKADKEEASPRSREGGDILAAAAE